jgi:hypothetical protein
MQSEVCQRATKDIKQKKNIKIIPAGNLDPILNPKETHTQHSVTIFNTFNKKVYGSMNRNQLI